MKLRVLAILAMACAAQLPAQTPSTSDCNGAIQLCGGVYTETSAPLGTGNVYEFTGGCNQDLESASIWYSFTVQTAGDLSFVLNPATNSDDYDWGLFNITTGGCAGINLQNGTSPTVECNSWGGFGSNGDTGISTANGGMGTTNGPGNTNGPPFNADLAVTVGQTYALVVMNWTGSTSGYTIDFTQSTASLYDQVPPTVQSLTADCSDQTFNLVFDEPIVTSTVSATDFTLTSPAGDVLPFTTVTPDDPSASLQADYTITLDNALVAGGTYTLTVTSASGNVEDHCGNIVVDTTFQVPITAPLDYDVAITTACDGAGGSVQATYVSGGVEPITFYLQGSVMSSGFVSGLAPGTYAFMLTDNGSCVINDSVTIPDHAAPELALTSTAASCAGAADGTATAEVVTSSAPCTFAWSPSGGSDTLATGLVAGTYTCVVADTNGCTVSQDIVVQEPDPLTVVVHDQVLCLGSSTTLVALVSGGTPPYTYVWFPEGPQIAPDTTGTYTALVADAHGCSALPAPITVTVPILPDDPFTTDTTSGCVPVCVNFSTAPLPGYSFVWDFGDGGAASSATVAHCYPTAGMYDVSLTRTDMNGCSSTVDEADLITAWPEPIAHFTPSVHVTSLATPVVQFNDQSMGAVQWAWDFAHGAGSSTEPSPDFEFTDVGCFPVLLTVTSVDGCRDTDSLEVCIRDIFNVYIPDCFTPDGDGLNEVLRVSGPTQLSATDFRFSIFDRWGHTVYDSIDPQQGWDGSGSSTGVYPWRIHYLDDDLIGHTKFGSVTLLR
jgi:gliding motility-associated-like protein